MNEILLIIVAALIAGMLDTIVGFGGGLLLLPILVARHGSTEAVLLSALIPLGWTLGRLPLLRPYIKLRAIGLFAIGIIPGAFAGGLMLNDINPDTLRLYIGILLSALGLYHIVRLYVEIPVPKIPDTWSFPLTGFVAAGLSALLGAGNGPFQSWAMAAAGMVPRELVAVNGALGGITGIVKLIAFWSDDMLQHMPWTIGIVGMIAGLGGALIGVRISRKSADSTLKLLIGVVIVAAGISLIVR